MLISTAILYCNKDGDTIKWKGLDIDPDMLFNISTPVKLNGSPHWE
jgi:hypothetical protein